MKPSLTLESVQNNPSGLKMVSSVGTDAMITGLAVELHFAEKLGIKNLRVTKQ